ncbi:DNA gyrase inhibitor YacG [Microvirga makkahensis]|uniref:DNA gyrase inhibitor YacG n=1 Tax=Microvirga makkahensis TaxID=1128670 RepID=A0A7X3MSY8_9HYPH|nr:DNA gyrase inhibitor YacG [Microvirga makkahensis]MXQ12671.1 DNA gyrase inhibitor YacG [Microvirga makkahensis]
MDPANENKPLASTGTCPICGKPTILDYKPFCSKRCADVDLNRWLSGSYAIPAVDDPEDRGEDAREDGQ